MNNYNTVDVQYCHSIVLLKHTYYTCINYVGSATCEEDEIFCTDYSGTLDTIVFVVVPSMFVALVLFASLRGEDGVSANVSRAELSGMHERG